MLVLKKISLWFWLSLFWPIISLPQLCGSSNTYLGILTPNLPQTTNLFGINTRPYFRFYANKNCSYIFNSCNYTTMDIEFEILSDVSFTSQYYNDDWCGLQSYIHWICPADGWYIFYITRYPCLKLDKNIRFEYFKDCGIVLGPSEEVIEEDTKFTPPEKIITRVFELDGREVGLDFIGICIIEYEDGTKQIIRKNK